MTVRVIGVLTIPELSLATAWVRSALFSRSNLTNTRLFTTCYPMDKAYFRCTNGEDQFQVSFQLKLDEFGINKECNFCRKLTETANTFLSRVNVNVEKVLEKKFKKIKRKVKDNEEKSSKPEIKAQLLLNNEPVPESFMCKELFLSDGKSYTLSVLNHNFQVVVNSPWIHNLKLPNLIMASFPVYPLKIETFLVDTTKSQFIWYRSQTCGNLLQWEVCGSGYVYNTTQDDTDKKLRLVCIPKYEDLEGPPYEVISETVVESGPADCPFERRHKFTEHKVGENGFRIISYNILADLYAETEEAKSVLFVYCPSKALSLNYRKLLLMKEILGYKGDILCLQEVDYKVYLYDLSPLLEPQGLKGIFSVKGGTVSEGVVCFYSTEKFVLLETTDLLLGTELQYNDSLLSIWNQIKDNNALVERVTTRPTNIQITALQSRQHAEEIVIVANTHLYFHPDADHIRLLQGIICFKLIQDFKRKILDQYSSKRISLVFCGDFNSSPDCGIYEFMTTKNVSESCIDWKSKPGEEIEGVSFSHNTEIGSAYGTPKYTNYTQGFKSCLDYIFYQSDNLEVIQTVPLPTEEELSAHIAIPSILFPSDHISLIADLQWKPS